MKKISLIGIVILGLAFTSCKGIKGEDTVVVPFEGFKTTADSLSYFIGSDLTNGLNQNGLGAHLEEGAFLQGMKDAKNGVASLVTGSTGQAIAMGIMQNKANDTLNSTPSFSLDYNGLLTSDDSLSYFIGNDMHANLERNGMGSQIVEESFVKGMYDAFNGDSLLIDKVQGNAIAMKFVQKTQAAQAEKAKAESLPKIAAGEAFLNAKSAEKDVVTLPSGLRYKILTKGNGAIPTAADKVRAHYHGTLIDGTVFDSSVERGQPFEFNAGGGVIQGWLEVAKLMPVGSKWEIYLPYTLAYGERGAGGKIGPYETLIFQIELLDIIK
jgi:FKBP-type peptidyl-prolyl cis-trans isomerase FklB